MLFDVIIVKRPGKENQISGYIKANSEGQSVNNEFAIRNQDDGFQ